MTVAFAVDHAPPMSDEGLSHADNEINKQEPQERSRLNAMHMLNLGKSSRHTSSSSSSLLGIRISESALDTLLGSDRKVNRIHCIFQSERLATLSQGCPIKGSLEAQPPALFSFLFAW